MTVAQKTNILLKQAQREKKHFNFFIFSWNYWSNYWEQSFSGVLVLRCSSNLRQILRSYLTKTPKRYLWTGTFSSILECFETKILFILSEEWLLFLPHFSLKVSGVWETKCYPLTSVFFRLSCFNITIQSHRFYDGKFVLGWKWFKDFAVCCAFSKWNVLTLISCRGFLFYFSFLN